MGTDCEMTNAVRSDLRPVARTRRDTVIAPQANRRQSCNVPTDACGCPSFLEGLLGGEHVVHVSISKLGSNKTDAGGAARAVVEYLTGQQNRAAGTNGEPSPELADVARPGGYYADSAQQPGRWHGAGAEDLIPSASRDHVDPTMLEHLLMGRHPVTGDQLVTATGSSGRADHSDLSGVVVSANGDPDELLTVLEAAKLIDVDVTYLTRLARTTQTRRTEIADTESTVTASAALPTTYLDGVRVPGETQNRPEWRFERGEIERFIDARKEPKVVMGFDLTYSAPKETSLAWAVADETGKPRIESHLRDQAVGKAALRYIEDNAIFVRRGRGHEKADGMIAASFLHNTSRELEPQLHVHVVVANMARGDDGNYQALDARGIYAHATPSAYLADAEYQVAMNADGYAHGPTVKGISHLIGPNQQTVDSMSSGRTRIMQEVGAVGADSPAARQLAALATRPAKDTSVDLEELQHVWMQRLAETGFGPAQHAFLQTHDAPLLWTPEDTHRLNRHLAGATGVTEQLALFDRRHVIETITDFTGGRLDAQEILDHADAWLVSENVLKLNVSDGVQADLIGDVGKVSLTPGLDLYTTPGIVQTEQRIAAAYKLGHNADAGIVDPALTTAAIERWQERTGHTLGPDQTAMVRAITSSGDRMQAVLGPAGSGKTVALEVAARAWEQAGFELFGAAVNGTAAEVLQASTGINSTTVAGLLTRLDLAADRSQPILNNRSVVVVDEAATLGNRAHARLVGHVGAAGATLRTVGDPAQHSSVEAGGMWAHMTRSHADRTPELTENRRMKGPDMADMRLAAVEYREGKIAEAIGRVNDTGRMVTAGTGTEVLDSLAADWYVDWKRHQVKPDLVKPSRMLAENHAARNELNRRAQVLLKADGAINGEGVRIGESTFHVGDQVIARAQNRKLRPPDGDRKSYVRNGTKGTVVGINAETSALSVNFEGRGVIEVPHAWLSKKLRDGVTGGLTPSYAMTTHAAQGDTFDASHSLVTDRSSREGQYVALTRGEHDVRFYAVDAAEFASEPPATEHGLPILNDRKDLIEEVQANLSRPKPADLATVSDLDLAGVMHLAHSGMSLRELEAVGGPHASRAADMIVARASAAVRSDPPAPLVAMIGERNPGDPQRWDNTANAYALYHQRWGSQPRAGHIAERPPEHAPATQHTDYSALRADLIGNRAHNNRHLQPVDLAAVRSELVSQLADAGPATSHLDSRITGHLKRRVATLEAREANLQAALSTATKPKQRRQNRDGPELARRNLSTVHGDLDVARAHLADHLAVSTQRPTQAAVRDRVGMELAVVDNVIDRHVTTAVSTPQAYRSVALGDRPNQPDKAARWDTAAAAVERYRIGTLGRSPGTGPVTTAATGAAHAIGAQPSTPVGQQQWHTANQAIAAINQPAPTLQPTNVLRRGR